MGKNILIEALKNNDNAKGKKAKGYFDPSASTICYPMGLPTLDYTLGYKVRVPGKNGEFEEYNNLGITAGTYALFIGKSSTGKTALVIKIAGNIIKPFIKKGGMVMHLDNERATTYSRVQSLTNLPIEDLKSSYILRQEKLSIPDIKALIFDIYKEKTENKDKYIYDTGKKDEFGNEIKLPIPTVIIIDSIANLSDNFEEAKDDENEEIGTQTDRLRLTGMIGRMFNEIMNFLKEANIILLCINHIKVNPQLGVIKSPSEMLYLSNQESLSGGRTHINLAHVLIKITAVGSEKYSKEDEGFDGFLTKATIIKSRTNADGKTVSLVYDKNTGHSAIRSTVFYLKELGLVSGNKNGYYFIDDPDKNKFTLATMEEDFNENIELYKVMNRVAKPYLEHMLGLQPTQANHEDYNGLADLYE